VIADTARRFAGLALLVCLSSCGSVSSPDSRSNQFSSGNFSLNVVASAACSTLADAGRSRTFKIGLVQTGSSVSSSMQGWGDSATVFAQTNLAGTATGSSLSLNGHIYETITGCSDPLCYRAEGTITATQSGNIVNGTLNGVLTYDQTTCAAPDHKVMLTRQ
jgi:hypothetical protein